MCNPKNWYFVSEGKLLNSCHCGKCKFSEYRIIYRTIFLKKMDTADFVTFTEEILHGKLHFLGSDDIRFLTETILACLFFGRNI